MRQLFELTRDKNQVLLIYSLLCLAGALICLVLSRYSSNQILGISGWIKPMKFFLSTTIFASTMGFYMTFLGNQKQVEIYSWSLVILLSVELVLIVYQAAQGKMSHFNVATSFDKSIFNIMAFAITLLMLHTLYIAVLFFAQTEFDAPDTVILAIKLSLLVTVIFAFEGFAMGAMLKHTVGSTDGSAGLPIINWSKNHGDLRVAHFFGMHALQLIPLASYVLAKTKRDVVIIACVYLAFVTYTLLQALQGKPFIKL